MSARELGQPTILRDAAPLTCEEIAAISTDDDPDPDDKGVFARWIPLVLLLLALLPTVAVFLVVGGALVFR